MAITTKIEMITPDIAKEMLTKNTSRNRTIRTRVAGMYARDMKNGNFKTTHQGIAFNAKGELVDGQHRLVAIVLSGIPMEMMVTRGVDDDAISYIDRGVSRSVHDSLMIANPGNDSISRVLKHAVVPSVIRQLVVCSIKDMNLSVSEINKVFKKFQDQIVELFGLNSAKHNGANRCQLLSAAVAAMYCGVSVNDIDKFFQVFRKADITECAGYNVNAALDWRRQIDEAKFRGARMPGDNVFFGTQNAIYNFVNNTNVKHIAITKNARYDVTDILKELVCVA